MKIMCSMKLIEVVLICLSISFCHSRFVIIRFNDIETYATRLFENRAFQARKQTDGVSTYCHDLLSARIFRIEDEYLNGNIRYSTVRRDFTISKQKWNELTIHNPRGTKQTNIPLSRTVRVHSFHCLDHYGEPNWIFTYDPFQSTGLLVFVASEHRAKKLAAVVYVAATFQGLSQNDVSRLFQEYNGLRTAQDTGNESLCNLNKNAVFRVCAVAADAFLTSITQHEQYPSTNLNEDFVFPNPHFHYQVVESNETCLRKSIRFTLNGFEYIYKNENVLHCHMKLKNEVKHFFLKQNVNRTVRRRTLYSLFFMESADDDDSSVKLLDEIHFSQRRSILETGQIIGT